MGGGGGQPDVIQQQVDPLTRAEQIRLERMRNAVSDIQNSDQFTDEEKANGILQLRTGINAYTMRNEQAQAQMRDQQLQLMQHQNAQQTTMQQEDSAFRARTLADRTQTLYNPDTDESIQMFEQRPGHYAPIQWPSEGRQQRDPSAVTPAHITTLSNQVRQEMDREAGIGQAVPPENPPFWAGNPDTRETEHQRRVRTRVAMMRNLLGQGGDQQPAQQPPTGPFQPGGMAGAAMGAGGMQPGGQPAGPGGTVGQPPAQPTPGQPPFNPGEVESQTPTQRAVMERFTRMRQMALHEQVPREDRTAIRGRIDEAMQLFSRHGSAQAMPRTDRDRFNTLLRELGHFEQNPGLFYRPNVGDQ